MSLPTARALFLMLCLLWPFAAAAHDPSAWGGLYRSRDNGATWFPADAGLFIGGAIALAIDPGDATRLLYGTDTRLLRSRNGGRDWVQEPGTQFSGPTYAVRYGREGGSIVASTANRIFFSEDGSAWTDTLAPAGAAPARIVVAGAKRLYLAGEHGLFASDNEGRAWQRVGEALPEVPVTSAAVVPGTRETVLVLQQGVIHASADAGATWRQSDAGLPSGSVDALMFDGRLWAAAQDRIFSSADAGASWSALGESLPERNTSIRGIASADAGMTLVLTTHRGVMRSTDGGKSWSIVEGALPVHLEAGPLVRDPHDAATLYAGFSLTPYVELWRRAAGGANLMSQLDPVSLAGAAAFLLLLIVGGGMGVGWLRRARG